MTMPRPPKSKNKVVRKIKLQLTPEECTKLGISYFHETSITIHPQKFDKINLSNQEDQKMINYIKESLYAIKLTGKGNGLFVKNI